MMIASYMDDYPIMRIASFTDEDDDNDDDDDDRIMKKMILNFNKKI